MFATDKAKGLAFRLEDGQMVIVQGNISVFERDGAYQLYAREIELSGEGGMYLRLEQLKRELAEKGYFDFERKKPLPPYPERIGIVTALTGAAIQDIRSIAARRNPFVQLYLYPARVQGEGAAESIARGIRYFDGQNVDVIIIGRGGGSAEDLWAFNERIVADAIFDAETPVISGTGHEIDMTIADYCADVRAATPSAACELAIPDVYAVIQQMDRYRDDLDSRMQYRLQRSRQRLEGLERSCCARGCSGRICPGGCIRGWIQSFIRQNMRLCCGRRSCTGCRPRPGLREGMSSPRILKGSPSGLRGSWNRGIGFL